jgi:hypothetical protein
MRVDDSIPPALTISFAFPRAPPPAIKPNRNRRCRAAGRIRPELWPGGAADFCLGIRFWEFDFDRIGRVNARSAVSRARGGAERCRCLFWEFFWEFCFGNSLLTGSVGGAGAAAKLSSRLAKTQWRQHGHIIIAFMLFVRFPAREAAPSGAPDLARALDCGAADFYFWEIGRGGGARG